MTATPISAVDPNTLTIITAQIGSSGPTNENFSDAASPYDPTKISVVSYGNATGKVDASLVGQFPAYGEASGDTFGVRINGLIGTSGSDKLGGNDNANYLNGGASNDTLWGGGGADTLEGGEGTWDRASYSESTVGVTVNLGGFYGIANTGEAIGDVFHSIEGLIGSGHNDILIANHGGIGLEGGFGSDTLVGGEGADWFYGSFETDDPSDTGIDVVSYQYAKSGVVADLSYTVRAGEAVGDRYSGIEQLTGSAFNDELGGNLHSNTLAGGAGSDTLWGYAGTDSLDGGEGIDWAGYELNSDAVEVSLVAGVAGKGGQAEGDILVNIEAVLGTRNGDKFIGNDGDNIFDGRAGADTMTGGKGHDTYYVNERGDQVNENANEGADLVITEIDYTLGANIENLTAKAGAFAAVNLTGNDLNNVITGNEYNNVINGGAGADTLMGGAGADVMIGGAGADMMQGGGGDDIYYVDDVADMIVDTSGNDTVYLAANIVVNPAIENVVAVGSVAIDFTGNAFANVFTGNAGSNRINGGLGNDVLSGGAGQDVFVFDSKIGTNKTNKFMNYDRIVDFDVKDDAIYLDNAIFKKLGKGSAAKPGKLKKDFFKVSTKAKDKNDYLVYDKKKGVLYYDADGKNSKKAVEIMKFDNKAKLTATDFFII